jgi:hypothetical protein
VATFVSELSELRCNRWEFERLSRSVLILVEQHIAAEAAGAALLDPPAAGATLLNGALIELIEP